MPIDFEKYYNRETQTLDLSEEKLLVLSTTIFSGKNCGFTQLNEFLKKNSIKSLVIKPIGWVEKVLKPNEKKHLEFVFKQIAQCMITSLTIQGYVGDESVETLVSAKHIKHLKIISGGVTDQFAVALAAANTLESLALINTPVRNEGAVALSKSSNLQSLVLESTKIDDEGMTALLTSSSISTLSVKHCWGITSVCPIALANNKVLVSLILDGCSVGNVGAAAIALNTSIKTLDMQSTNIDDAGVISLCQLPALENLNIRGNKLIRSMKEIAQKTSIKYLDVSNCSIGPTDAAYLAASPHLIKLNISGNKIREGAQAFGPHNRLVNLNVGGCEINSFGAQAIATIKTLLKLNISENKEADAEAIRAIVSNLQITRLYIVDNNKMSREAVEEISKSTSIKKVSITHTSFSTKEICLILSNQNIVHFEPINFNNVDGRVVIDKLRTNINLRTFDFNSTLNPEMTEEKFLQELEKQLALNKQILSVSQSNVVLTLEVVNTIMNLVKKKINSEKAKVIFGEVLPLFAICIGEVRRQLAESSNPAEIIKQLPKDIHETIYNVGPQANTWQLRLYAAPAVENPKNQKANDATFILKAEPVKRSCEL